MELKVGDKIRLVGNVADWIKGSEGVICQVRPPEREYHYQVYIYIEKTKRSYYYLLRDNEIEKIVTKGQQLMFAFMDEVS